MKNIQTLPKLNPLTFVDKKSSAYSWEFGRYTIIKRKDTKKWSVFITYYGSRITAAIIKEDIAIGNTRREALINFINKYETKYEEWNEAWKEWTLHYNPNDCMINKSRLRIIDFMN